MSREEMQRLKETARAMLSLGYDQESLVAILVRTYGAPVEHCRYAVSAVLSEAASSMAR